jgi:hypothetical protein
VGQAKPSKYSPATISPLLILIGLMAIYAEIKIGGIGLPLLIAVVLMAGSQFCGINAIIYYSTKIFESAGLVKNAAFSATAATDINDDLRVTPLCKLLLGNRPERPGIEHLPATEGRFEDLTVAPAAVNTPGTQTRDRCHAPGAVHRLGCLIGIGL